MADTKTIKTVQSLQTRTIAYEALKRLAPGVIAVVSSVVGIVLVATVGPDALHALAGSVG